MDADSPVTSGLEGVIAGRSSICEVDEDNSELFYYGYSILELAEKSTFEEVAYLLLYGKLPVKKELMDFCKHLTVEREIPQKVKEVINLLPLKTDPMDVLKIAIGVLHTVDTDSSSNNNEANLRKAIRLIAKIPTIIAGHYRFTKGSVPILPNANLSHAANFLYMLKGKEPDILEANALDKSMILYAEHELNASTFAARIVASTLSDMHSAVISAIATLKGPLHGGANERVMKMLLEIGKPENVDSWIKDALSKKERIMGFGHRVYKRQDPRTPIIKDMAKELGEKLGKTKWFEMSQMIEDVMNNEKKLHANLDFYTSSVYYLLDMPIRIYTPIFAASRVTGWAAHIIEQYNDNKLIRPRAEYVGPERRRYIPIDERE